MGPIHSYQGATEQADGKSKETLPQFAQTVAAGEPSSKSKAPKKKSKHKKVIPEPYSGEFVVARDVENLLGQETVKEAIAGGTEWDAPFTGKEEIELIVSGLSSTGDSLSIAPSPRKPWVIVTPLALPGEKIRVRVYRHARLYSHADLLEVVTANPEWRDMTRVQCEYFGKCAGCQYQMLSYETQLQLKRNAVVKAYENFSGLLPSSISEIPETIGSPLQYGYRTKITPHFDALPRKLRKDTKHAFADSGAKPDWLRIGFNQIGTRQVMDIEECPIATPTLNEALPSIRQNVIQNAWTYKKGVSLLLRDSSTISTEPMTPIAVSVTQCDAIDGLAAPLEEHVCVTNHKATVRERVGDTLFEYTAGSFFQNNNSVLLPLTSYVRDAIFPPSPSFPTSAPTHLVDAYCGSGLFAITLAPYFQQVAGIEISEESIRCATRNAELNCLPMGRCKFMAGDAANIFATVQDFPREHTALIIDPPRKGTDEKFIDQLLQFNCATVVYVSCNVHTQARDVGMILRKSEQRGGCKYVMQSLRGFDLFPQTAHVESVAVLRLV
ncbi:S-adenosyl-L-methionine-dependent methyltransferase [Laetiporus sulphureus 93-53]|uniref:S-adenosyl-L-methionine-dependent methyltransferase n=1 Tax=Laetiporus sulphureus 93-53 TaxID=1314785 RepID=A0A165FJ29_9APHY|nr:S-adenosyl-L-methionine-dependent methyltransferase [Laetiporus sulphureus 93-53]KZT09047.1 S-adenosyl-L-methionine-dependent methyltransferase [Laetiporus sulphureus 93-53]